MKSKIRFMWMSIVEPIDQQIYWICYDCTHRISMMGITFETCLLLAYKGPCTMKHDEVIKPFRFPEPFIDSFLTKFYLDFSKDYDESKSFFKNVPLTENVLLLENLLLEFYKDKELAFWEKYSKDDLPNSLRNYLKEELDICLNEHYKNPFFKLVAENVMTAVDKFLSKHLHEISKRKLKTLLKGNS